jgi:glycerol-3-phosphate dehydrogenase
LRPLIEKETKETYSSSRKYEIFDNKDEGLDGLITVEGGKYTTSRKLAETCVKIVAGKLGRDLGKSITKKHYLAGCEIKDLCAFLSEAGTKNSDFGKPTMDYLGRNYGAEYADVIKLARADKALAETVNEDGEILAQVIYAVREEMARTLPDIVMRRTGIGTLGNPGEDVLRKVAQLAAKELQWSADRVEKEVADTVNLLKIPG